MPLAVEKEDEFVENEVGHRVPAGTKRKPSGQPADRAAIAVTFCRGGSEKLEKPSEEAIEHCLFFRGRAPRGGTRGYRNAILAQGRVKGRSKRPLARA